MIQKSIVIQYRIQMKTVRNMLRVLDPISKLTGINQIDEINKIRIIEQKSGIKPSQMLILLVISTSLYIASYFTRVSNIFVWFVCFFIPAYFTLVALKDKNPQTIRKYLIYWVLYPLILQSQSLVKMMFNRTIFNLLRVLLMVLFLNQSFDIGTKFYQYFLRPLIQSQKTNQLDQQFDNLIQQGKQTMNKVSNSLKNTQKVKKI